MVDDPFANYARAMAKANPIDPGMAAKWVASEGWDARVSKGALGERVPGVIGSCWIWVGSWDKLDGYGYWSPAGAPHRMRPHRVALVAKLGRDIRPGFVAGHVCHDLAVEYGSCHPFRKPLPPCYHRRCVNPDHLEEMPPKENAYARRNKSWLQERKPPEL